MAGSLSRLARSGAVNNRMDLEPMALKPANLDISGVVVRMGDDQPVRGVNVVCFGRGRPVPIRPGKTDAQGRVLRFAASVPGSRPGPGKHHGGERPVWSVRSRQKAAPPTSRSWSAPE